ncbi:Prostaglandin E synthase 2, partial [Eumeta japonica]
MVVSDNDTSNLQLVLFQYKTCPFCCKVRAFLDYHGISYDIVEVDAVLRQAIKWSEYKKVPILLAKVDDGYQSRKEWRQWADSVLVHVLSPNVYRTPSEALQAFRWFEEAGGWKQTFPTWECALMVYGGAFAMWLISKRLKARHNLNDDVRVSLYNAAKEWMNAVNAKGKFLGGNKPNLADVSVYGVLSSIEGCTAFQDLRE